MKPIVKNVLAVVLGFAVGSAVNMGLILLGHQVIPPPPGADISTMEGLANSIHLFEPKHFLFPFLAHAIGTLAGAVAAAAIAASHKRRFAMAIGLVFLAAGVTNVFMLPGPAWFNTVDLVFAYVPMGWLGGKLAVRLKKG